MTDIPVRACERARAPVCPARPARLCGSCLLCLDYDVTPALLRVVEANRKAKEESAGAAAAAVEAKQAKQAKQSATSEAAHASIAGDGSQGAPGSLRVRLPAACDVGSAADVKDDRHRSAADSRPTSPTAGAPSTSAAPRKVSVPLVRRVVFR